MTGTPHGTRGINSTAENIFTIMNGDSHHRSIQGMRTEIVANPDGSITTKSYDDASGALDHEFTSIRDPWLSFEHYIVVSATDYDLNKEHNWASYTVRHALGGFSQVLLRGTEAVMDDGTTIRLDISYFGGLSNMQYRYAQTWTTLDAAGRVDDVTTTYDNITSPSGRWWGEASFQALDYDTATGRLDYSIIHYWDGRQEAIDYDPVAGNKDFEILTDRTGRVIARDYDPATGQIDYVIETADGRYTASDYDPATGKLDYVIETFADGRSVASDYDPATGQLDYVIETFADCRYTATDYDLADAFSWTIYTIAYAASGEMLSAVAA